MKKKEKLQSTTTTYYFLNSFFFFHPIHIIKPLIIILEFRRIVYVYMYRETLCMRVRFYVKAS